MAVTSDWKTVVLADVAELDIERVRVEPDEEYQIAGVAIAGRGLFWRDTISGRETNYSALHRLREGQLVMRKLTAWEGPITTVPPDFDGGYVSGEFPTFTLNHSRLLPQYMRLVCQRADFHAEMKRRSTGTAERRNRLNPDGLLQIAIDLPPLADQRQIVAAVEAADMVRSCLTAEDLALGALLKAAQQDAFASLPEDSRRLADITDVVSGGTPARDRPGYFGGEIAWVKSGDVAFQDLYETPEMITEAAVSSSAAKLLPAKTVVVAMYGQGATRGRCAVLQAPMTTNQACAGILPSADMSERFVFHWLWSRYEALRDDSEGTSQPNMSKGAIENLEIPVPPLKKQEEIATILDSILGHSIRVKQERLRADDLRMTLVDSFLSGGRRVRVPPMVETANA